MAFESTNDPNSVSTAALAVNAEWAGSTYGQEVTLGTATYYFGQNAFASFKDVISAVTADTTSVIFAAGTYSGADNAGTQNFVNKSTGTLTFSTTGAVKSSDPVNCTGTILKLGTETDTPRFFDEATAEKFTLAAGSDLTVFQFETAKYGNVFYTISGNMRTDSTYYTKSATRTDIAKGATLTVDGSVRPSANGTSFCSYGTTNVNGTLNINLNYREDKQGMSILIGNVGYQNKDAQLNVNGGTVTVRSVDSAAPQWEQFSATDPTATTVIFPCSTSIEGDAAASLNVTNGGLYDTTGAIANAGTITIDVKQNADGRYSLIKASTVTSTGTINIDVTGATAAAYKLIDASGASSYGTVNITGSEAANYTYAVYDNDLYAVMASNITVTADSASKTYDGKALTKNSFTYTGSLIEGDKLEVTVEGTITDAGTAENKVTSCKVMRNGVDVTALYTFNDSVSGTLEVTKRSVTLTSADDSKIYDGTPLTNDTVTVSGSGWAGSEGATYNVTGSQTDVGSSKNTFTYTLNGDTKEGNYSITTVEGTLTVTPAGTVCSISNYNDTAKSDILRVAADGKVSVMRDTAAGYKWSVVVNDITGWKLGEARHDVTGDGLADVQILCDSGNMTYVAALRNDYQVYGVMALNYNYIGGIDHNQWNYIGSADVDADGKAEVLMMQTEAGSSGGIRHVAAWVTNDAGQWVDNTWVGGLTGTWTITGTADVDGNGTDNVMLCRADGMIGYWSETGSNQIVEVWNANGSTMLTSGDFAGSGVDGILWNNVYGDYFTWNNITTDLVDVKIGNVSDLGGSWAFGSVGDYNGDGKDDILWRNTATGTLAYGGTTKETFADLVQIA